MDFNNRRRGILPGAADDTGRHQAISHTGANVGDSYLIHIEQLGTRRRPHHFFDKAKAMISVDHCNCVERPVLRRDQSGRLRVRCV